MGATFAPYIAAKADLEHKNVTSGMTPLLVACCNKGRRQVIVAQLLLEAGADTEARRKDGSTALVVAVQDEKDLFNVSLVELLLEFGADVGAARKDGKTALDLAEEIHAGWRASVESGKAQPPPSSVDMSMLKQLLQARIKKAPSSPAAGEQPEAATPADFSDRDGSPSDEAHDQAAGRADDEAQAVVDDGGVDDAVDDDAKAS